MSSLADQLIGMPQAAPQGWQARPRLVALGAAVPPLQMSQADIAEAMARVWKLRGAALQRWRRIVTGSGIHTRHGVLPVEQVVNLSTQQRMSAYEQHAPPLAASAASQALDAGALDSQCITDLIIVSCTGFSAPGLDVELVERLELRPDVRRSTIGFMGCFGAITGLRAAIGCCTADPSAVALVVCAELCSLHMRADPDPQNQVAAALFADGAAAAVVAGEAVVFDDIKLQSAHARRSVEPAVPRVIAPLGRLSLGRSLLLPEGRPWMSWRITDAGFAMTLERQVPQAVRRHIRTFVVDPAAERPLTYIVHPGGPGIIDAVEDALPVRDGLEHARSVLRDYGNLSSGTVLFVLQRALQRRCVLPALVLAFGPGLTFESALIHPAVV